jgi:uncharacterized protein (TIGR02270 family)
LNLVRAPHVDLSKLARFDERIAAHLDGISLDGAEGVSAAQARLESGDHAECFVLAAVALASGNGALLGNVRSIAQTLPACMGGMLAAYGWSEPKNLRGEVKELLLSAHDISRFVGVAACGLHRLDPGLTAARHFEDESPLVRARAWRTAGEIGKRELVSTAAAASTADDDPTCQFWAAWSAVLLGDKQTALEALSGAGAVPGPERRRAFQLTLQAMSPPAAHRWLATLAKEPTNQRWLLRGAGLVGDPAYVPWLIQQMADLKVTRLAGESFSLITGLDLAWLDLEVKPPANFESGPNDDPNDPNVDMDEDDGLPWPDAVKIQAWWHANSNRFQSGTRYFMGEPLNRDNCLRVLKEGFQRQRIAAAYYLSLLNPGTPLFEWRAPARRQQRLLAEMH